MNDYLSKYQLYPLQIHEKPNPDLNLCVVIPCFDEPDVISSLNSLKMCDLPLRSVEVIVVVNSGENTDFFIVQKNRKTFIDIQNWIAVNSSEKLKFHAFNVVNLPHKFAGVGFARKIGMDEAYSRLVSVENENGIILGFDADSTCKPNYLCEVEKHFDQNLKSTGASIYFEHPLQGFEFEAEIYENIVRYELYLRYYKQALQFADFPFAFHTIGSSFAVRANIYAKQGGMNRRKAGEDFYFLQKIIPLGNYHEINTTTVFPSPRPSDRVPFGTGAAIQKMLQNNSSIYLTYSIQAFLDLKTFFREKNIFYKTKKEDAINYLNNNKISEIIVGFLLENSFFDELIKINENSPNLKVFNTRFFQWFNAFRVLKFLNFSHENYYQKDDIEIQASNFLQIAHHRLTCNFEAKGLLEQFRVLDCFKNEAIELETQIF